MPHELYVACRCCFYSSLEYFTRPLFEYTLGLALGIQTIVFLLLSTCIMYIIYYNILSLIISYEIEKEKYNNWIVWMEMNEHLLSMLSNTILLLTYDSLCIFSLVTISNLKIPRSKPRINNYFFVFANFPDWIIRVKTMVLPYKH